MLHRGGMLKQELELTRWFTPETGNDLAVRPEDFTSTEKAVFKEILAFARDPAN